MESGRRSLLNNSRFLKLWAGQGLSFVGDAISMVALVILVAEITGSASAVGGLLVARLLPTLLSPLAGVLADRLDRRAILVVSDICRAGLIVSVVFTRELVVLYVLVFLMGLARAVFNPTIRAAFPSIVSSEELIRANALISGTFSLSMMLGPALGGLMVSAYGVDVAFVLNAVTYLISAGFLALIPLPRPQRDDEESFVRELKTGFGYLAGARIPLAIVVGAFLTMLVTDLTIPAEVFLARDTFDAGDTGYGLLVSLWGAGMVAGSALTAILNNRVNLIFLYFTGIFVWALALFATGLSPTFALALGALTIAGVANGIDNVATDTILQRRVPDALLGRVFSVRFMGYSVAEAVAYPAGGLIVDAVGPRTTYLFAGSATAVAGVLILLFIAAGSAKTRSQHG